MSFFAIVTLAMIAGMGWYTKSIKREIDRGIPPEEGKTKPTFHTEYQTELIALGAMQFALFAVCYGVARMICQPWMWELHFWPVFSLTIVAIFSAALFVWLVSPGIPTFCAMQSVPPYVDNDNLEIMLHISKGVKNATSSSSTR